MVVHTKNKPTGLVGLHIGSRNVRQFFPENISMIELELDHLRIVCPLEASFWKDRPEIHDTRLSSWLEAKRTSGKLEAKPGEIAMIPSGDCTYRLQPMPANQTQESGYPVGLLA